MRYLVTGGCGFIGSNFVKFLLRKEPAAEIVNLDKLTYAGRRENLREVEGNKNYSFVKGDICSRSDAEKAMKGADIVVNFAAETHVDRSIAESSEFLETNILGVRNLLECVRRFDVERVIQISTDETYGSVEKGYSKETDALKPRNPYSASKAAADMLALSYYSTYGLDVVITRSSNNYGPNQFPEKVIPLFVTNLLHGKKVPLYGDGLNQRDWTFVEDNCEGLYLAAKKGGKGEIYNISSGHIMKNIELTRKILELLGIGEEMIEWVKDRPGHDRRYAVDSSKAMKELGWKARTGLEEGLRKTVQWYRENEWWWKPLVK